MSDFQNRPPVKSNALKDSKLKLVADPHEKATQRNGRPQAPTLQVAIKDNQPRFIAYTNVEGDKQDGKIEAAMDAFTFSAVMEAIRTYARGELVDDKKIICFPCIGFLWTQQGKSEKPMALANIFVGLNADNVVVISVQSTDKSRPKISWKLYPTEWHGGLDAQGAQLSNKAISRLYATGYANLIEGLVHQILNDEHISMQDIMDRKGKGNGGGGGGFNRNGGGGNRGGFNGGNNNGGQRQNNYSNNKPAEPEGGGFDELIPF